MAGREVLVIYNEPSLAADDPDRAAEAGVLEAVDAVRAALTAGGHIVRALPVGGEVGSLWPLLAAAAARRAVALNLCEGLGGRGWGEAQVAGLIELAGLPLTGSPSWCLALARDKFRTKLVLQGAGLPTPEFVWLPPGKDLPAESLRTLLSGGPVIVKPAAEDASLGIGPASVAHDLASVERLARTTAERYGPVLVERFIAGREFNVAIIETAGIEVLPVAEIEFAPELSPSERIVGYQAKWRETSRLSLATPVRCPAAIDAPLARSLQSLAAAAFAALGCRDYARVDFRVDAQAGAKILEVNPNPDIGTSGGFARALAAANRAYNDFVDRLVDRAANRSNVRQ